MLQSLRSHISWHSSLRLPCITILYCLLSCVVIPRESSAQGSLLLVGGGSENYNDWSDQPYKWLVDHAANKKILVMHYSTGSAWLEGYFKSFGAVSASSLVVSSTAAANDSVNYRTILGADGIFLRGGDQYQYISKWKGTLTEKAIREVFQRGGVIGGTSAGEAVLSSVIFDARITSTDPRTALRNPMSAGISFTEDFLGFAQGLLADSHFYERGRLGRLLAMIALYRTQTGKEITGLGVDYNTAFAVSPDGLGEVMGSGTVTVLRFGPSTKYLLEANKPLSISNMRLDQLTNGWKFNTVTGTLTPPPTAQSYQPKSVSFAADQLLFDGSGSRSDWFSAAGSLKRLTALLPRSSDTIGIIASPVSAAIAVSIDSCLKQWNIASTILWIDAGRKNDTAVARSLSRCAAFVLAGNNGDTLSALLNTATAVGTSFFDQLSHGAAALFLGSDGILSSENSVWQLEKNIYGAYYGYLTLVPGTGVMKGISLVPRLYENADYIDNRASGLFWGMAKSGNPYGILLDAGTTASIVQKSLRVFGQTPAMVIDARSVRQVDFPSWKDPGKAVPRQNAAFIGAMIHVVRDSASFELAFLSGVSNERKKNGGPEIFFLEQNYPNPFNPTTAISFQLSAFHRASLKIYDFVGREVTTLVNEVKEPGKYTVQFNGSALSSGVYFVVLENGGQRQMKKMLMLK